MTDFNPYEAPTSVVDDPSVGEYQELADRGSRLAAKILDGLIGIGGIGIMAAIMIPVALTQGESATKTRFIIMVVLLGVALTLGVLAWNLTWLYRYGQTIGKRIVKIKIVRCDGDRASLGRILGLRIILVTILESIPFLGGLFSLVNICFIFRDDRRCIHDLMADTVVVKA